MLDILFGWRKASKCKKQIRQLRRRLKLLMNKRGAMLRQSRQDVAQLVKLGHDEAALHKAELLFKDECMMEVYELLDRFCEFILIHMPYVRKNKDLPNDIKEAVSSLIYASARCGDLPELLIIRALFGQRYGQTFATAALELVPGNLVNPQLKEHLNVQSVPEYVKQKLVDEITQDYCIQPEILAIEYPSEVIENISHEVPAENQIYQIQDPQVVALYPIATDRKVLYVNSSSSNQNSFSTAAHSHQDSNTCSTSVASSIAQQSSPDASDSPVHNQVGETENFIELDKLEKATISDLKSGKNQLMHKSYNTNTETKEEVTSASSSRCFVQFDQETVVYLDDVEEYQSFISNTGDIQDQRLFKFRSSMPQNILTSRECSKQSDGDEYQSSDEEVKSFRSTLRSSVEKSRWSFSKEIYFKNDIDCTLYYGGVSDNNSEVSDHEYSRQRKLRRMSIPPQQREQFCFFPNRAKQPCRIDTGTTLSKHSRQDLNHNDSCISRNSNEGDLVTPLRQNLDLKDTVAARSYPEEQTQDREQEIRIPESSSCSEDPYKIDRSSKTKELQPPTYMRAITMPSERHKDCSNDKMTRSNTCLNPHPNHVHPKLPDYDDLAAKFLAFRKEHVWENSP